MTPEITPKFTAGIDLIARTGTNQFQIRWCGGGDDAEQPPIAWVAVASYPDGRFDCAAAVHPESAVLRLCEKLIDGGICQHCGRPTAFEEGADDSINQLLLPEACWYVWDPELSTFRRSCEGS